MPTISSTLNVNTLDDAEVYYVEWKDNVGLISSIPCYGNGWAKDNYGGAEEWFRAALFKRVGSSEASAVQCYEIVLRAYLADGTQVVNSSWPKNVNNASYIALVGYDENISHMTYKAEFYSLNHELLGSYSISRSVDGSSAPRYTEEQYAWSNVSSTSGVGEEPSPNSGWQTSIAPQVSYAYLWKKIVLYTYNIGTNQYTAGTPQYYRMNGENGTSIHTRGSVLAVIKYWASSISDLPTSGEEGGTLAWVDGDSFLMEYHEGSTGWWSQSIALNEGDRIICTDTVNRTAAVRKNIYEFDGIDDLVSVGVTVNDGDAYTEAQNGHLMQWSQEATNWLDLGQFKGESGITYYTHIAWADSVTFRSTPLPPATGCLNKQNASSVTGGTITPRTSQSASKPYMGIRIDQIAGSDSRDYLTYTWELVQGAKGDRGKTGKFYYYAGVFNDFEPSDTFVVNDANAPYFKYTSGNETHYWVFVKEVSEGRISKSEMGTPSSSNADWEIMTDDFKYMITEAIFGNFAKFGSFIISGDWMISQNAATGSSSQNFTDFGKNVPTGGDPLVDNGTNFIPVFAVNGLTGRGYLQDAFLKGFVKPNKTIITDNNYTNYITNNVLDIDKCGSFVEIQASVLGGQQPMVLPLLSKYHQNIYTDSQKDLIRSFLGTKIIVYNKTGHYFNFHYRTGYNGTNYNSGISNNCCATLECKYETDTSISGGYECIYWEITDGGNIV